MIRTASLETVGPCVICEGTGKEIAYTEHRGKAIPLAAIPETECTHCQGSGLQPQKQICPLCNGIGGFSERTVRELNAHRSPDCPPITRTRCPACLGNGWMHLCLTHGQEFDNQEILPR